MTFKEGLCYHIRFYDHYIGGAEKMMCEVVGWVYKQDDIYVYLSYWKVDHEDSKLVTDNLEPTGLFKSAIVSRKLLRNTGKLRLT